MYFLALGARKYITDKYFIIIDKKVISCKAQSSVAAFDELFKAHFVFSVSYNEDLGLNSIQTLCLLCNVPLMFGDIVKENDKY